ncbi:hypothetical protein MMC13_007165 [Lambiella insularis]|nr:hypothetical protein [Lambiella insularis]
MAEETAASTALAVNDTVTDSEVKPETPKAKDAQSMEDKAQAAGDDEAKETATKGEGNSLTMNVVVRKSTRANEAFESDSKTNGHRGQLDRTTGIAEPKSTDDDVKMRDTVDSGESSAHRSSSAAAVANDTPISTKKASNGSSKKKSSAIPEHKTKKLNKKKSKPQLRLDARPGQMYLARLKGHQPWPSIICDEEMLPDVLLSSRPITTAQSDGTFKKAEYADGGKRENERTFPIMFLETNEFAWIINTELSPLTPEECKEVIEKGKSKSLLAAYKIAAQGHDLAHFKEMLAEHMAAMQEDAEAKAERDAKKASKAKRKSGEVSAALIDEDADEMDVDDEEGEAKPKSKKRKKSLDSDEAGDKPAKTPKTGTKLKLSTPKTPTAESSTKKRAAKPKAASKKAAPQTNGSDEEMIDTPMVEEKSLSPAEAKEKKEKEIRYYRHKLQKGFLSRDTVPADEEIKASPLFLPPSMSGFLTKLETYPDLEGSIIRATKIHKVLKAMIRLSTIPKDEEYHFKKRSHELLTKWNKILQDDPTAGGDKDDDAKDDAKPKAAITNGTSKETDEHAAKAETGESIAPEEESQKTLEKKIGTTVEGSENEVSTAGKTDEPNIDSAPAADYQPPTETSEATA